MVRLKLRHPVHFHIRFPVVPRLVSYFPSASYRRRLRQGQADTSVVRARAQSPGSPEPDYPFVEHDEPRDPRVRAAIAGDFFTDVAWYGGSYDRLRALFIARWQAQGDPDDEAAARLFDDRLRRRLFEMLDEARRQSRKPGVDSPLTDEAAARAVAEAHLGPIAGWLPAFHRYSKGGVTRLVVIPTWQCELRCNYCYIPKQDGRVMARATLERAVDLLLSSERAELTLQFFGGEAMLEWALVQHAIAWGSERARSRGKSLAFVLSSNGWSLDAARLEWLSPYPVKLELSLDGDPGTQRAFRPARRPGEDSYTQGIAPRAPEILASGLAYDVIMVLHPQHVHRLVSNFLHIASLGFARI